MLTYPDANTRGSSGEFDSLSEPEPQARVNISTFEFSQSPSLVCISGYVSTHAIFSFFYKIKPPNVHHVT